MNFYRLLPGLCLLAVLGLSSCQKSEAPSGGGGAPPSVPSRSVLKILAPEGHFPPWLIQDAEQKLGGTIIVETYSSPAQAREKLAVPDAGFDLVAGPDQLFSELIQEKKLTPLDTNTTAKLPPLEPMFTGHSFDRANQFILPYGFSLAGIAYDTNVVKNPPKTWKEWDAEAIKSKTDLPENPELIAAIESKAEGRKIEPVQPAPAPTNAPVASTNSVSVSPNGVAGMTNEPSTNTVVSVTNTNTNTNAVAETHPYKVNSIDRLQRALGTNSNFKIILPNEGTIAFLYHVGVVSNAPHASAAYAFMTNLFETNTCTRLADENHWAITERASKERLTAETNNVLVYPHASIIDHSVFVRIKPAAVPVSTLPPTSPH